MKHTPGPWRAIIRKNGGGITNAFVDMQSGGHIAIPLNNPETAEANARLIAAAPELLEALQTWIAACDTGTHTDINQAREQARAAIAKATGEA